MDEYAAEAAKRQNRYIIPDPDSEKGYFFRSDHSNFAKIGISALYASGSYEGFNQSIEEIHADKENDLTNIYHQPSDEYDSETAELKRV